MNYDLIYDSVVTLLKSLEIDLDAPDFIETPKRMTKVFMETLFGGTVSGEILIAGILSKKFPCDNDNMVIIKDIDCWGMCPHHFLPIHYKVNVGYIPNKEVLGLSKIPRLVELLAKRPVLQETFTQDIIDNMEIIKPKGVIAIVEGSHLCMKMRGVKKNSNTITSAVTGIFKEEISTKTEFLELLKVSN